MSAVAIAPSKFAHHPPCSWCGLRIGQYRVAASPTCTECKNGGRTYRVRAYTEQLRRAAEKK